MSTHNFVCRDLPLEKVVVFNDRAQVRRKAAVKLQSGSNTVKISHMTQSLFSDSVRVEGVGNATIHDVSVQDLPSTVDEMSSEKFLRIRAELTEKQDEVKSIEDRKIVLNKRLELLQKLSDKNSKTNSAAAFEVTDEYLGGLTKFFDYYTEAAVAIKTEEREVERLLTVAKEEENKLNNEMNQARFGARREGYSRVLVVELESEVAEDVELTIEYQLQGASWKPFYDIRVDTDEKPHLKLTYYATIQQSTGEDWNEVNLVLSTAQPCVGGQLPQLGTLEASIHCKEEVVAYARYDQEAYRGREKAGRSMKAYNTNYSLFGAARPPPMEVATVDAKNVNDNGLSTEFAIHRATTINSNGQEHKVTIGIIDMKPQLLHECVPSKNTSVFLTAAAVNESRLTLLPAQASVYLNNSFIAKSRLKRVSPSERFSCSLGVDAAVRIEYKPAKTYQEQSGLINKTFSKATEQTIVVKNTKKDAVLVLVKEQIPRSTDEKIKVRMVSPHINGNSNHTTSEDELPKEGARLTPAHNLEWTVAVKAASTEKLVVKYLIDHPKDEKIDFSETRA